jgi:hypothetical protein
MASCSVLKLHGKAVTQSLRTGSGDHSRVDVDRYQALLGTEAIMQQFQRETPATAYIHNHRVRGAPVRNQAFEIAERVFEYVFRPGASVSEPSAKAGFRHVQSARRPGNAQCLTRNYQNTLTEPTVHRRCRRRCHSPALDTAAEAECT